MKTKFPGKNMILSGHKRIRLGRKIIHITIVQVMPTQLRSQGTALANVMSMVSQIASPYIVESVSATCYPVSESLYI
jgi:hypothetical protein